MSLFGGAATARANSQYLVEFKAGKMFKNANNMVTPDKRKGSIYVYQSGRNNAELFRLSLRSFERLSRQINGASEGPANRWRLNLRFKWTMARIRQLGHESILDANGHHLNPDR